MINPHDKFFKETFGDVAVTKDFLYHYLPSEVRKYIKLDTLVPQKDSFIDDELKESFSDLLFKVDIHDQEGYVYLLFEHKSSPERGIVLQLLKYLVNIWESKTKKQREWDLPVVVPLVIYQGRDNWHVPSSLGEMIGGYNNLPKELKVYVPDFTYQLYDLSHRSDEEIKGQAILKIYHTLIREISNPNNDDVLQSILKAIAYLVEIDNKQKGSEYFETVIRYIFGAGKNLTEYEVQKILEQVDQTYPEGSDVVVTLAEHYMEKGMEKGMERGKQEGIRLGIIIGITRLLMKNFGEIPEEVHDELHKLDLSTLETILENVSDFEQLEDVEKYIH